MKIRQILFGFVLLLTFSLAACSPQTGPMEEISEVQSMTFETASDSVNEKADVIIDDEATSDDVDERSDHNGDSVNIDMMDDIDESAMKDGETVTGEEMEMDDHSSNDMMGDDDAMLDEKVDISDLPLMSTPEWFNTSFMDVNTGEEFVVADYKGKIILVETLAMWCSNCLKQQNQVKTLHDLVGKRADFISLGLDIDPNENAAALKSYTSNHGFDWIYAIAPAEVSRELSQLYGPQYLNPPSTPMLIIDREAEVHLLPFGIKSAEDLFEALRPFLDADM